VVDDNFATLAMTNFRNEAMLALYEQKIEAELGRCFRGKRKFPRILVQDIANTHREMLENMLNSDGKLWENRRGDYEIGGSSQENMVQNHIPVDSELVRFLIKRKTVEVVFATARKRAELCTASPFRAMAGVSVGCLVDNNCYYEFINRIGDVSKSLEVNYSKLNRLRGTGKIKSFSDLLEEGVIEDATDDDHKKFESPEECLRFLKDCCNNLFLKNRVGRGMDSLLSATNSWLENNLLVLMATVDDMEKLNSIKFLECEPAAHSVPEFLLRDGDLEVRKFWETLIEFEKNVTERWEWRRPQDLDSRGRVRVVGDEGKSPEESIPSENSRRKRPRSADDAPGLDSALGGDSGEDSEPLGSSSSIDGEAGEPEGGEKSCSDESRKRLRLFDMSEEISEAIGIAGGAGQGLKSSSMAEKENLEQITDASREFRGSSEHSPEATGQGGL
jgi:hypothetical protein